MANNDKYYGKKSEPCAEFKRRVEIDSTLFVGDVIPNDDSTYDLGTSAKRWKDIYLTGGTLHLGNANISDSAFADGKVLTGSATGKAVWRTPSSGGVTSVTGTTNRITSSGGATPSIDIAATYVGQTSLTTLGTIGTGVWNGSSISTTYTDAKVKTVTGTANRLTVGGTSTDPTFDISTSYVGQNTITTLGTIGTGTWQGTAIGNTYGGTGINTSASSGVAQVSSGTWSVSTALPSTTTATTQTIGDNSTKVATTAYSDANAALKWGVTGNAITAGQFFGTTNNTSTRIRANNTQILVLDSTTLSTFTSTSTAARGLTITQNVAGNGGLLINNTNGTGSAASNVAFSNGTASAELGLGGASYSTSGAFVQNGVWLDNNGVGGISISARNASAAIRMYANTTQKMGIYTTGVGVGVTSPSALLHLAAGTATANTAPLKFNSGTNLTTVENGTVEYDGTNYYLSAGGTRQTIMMGKNGSYSNSVTGATSVTVTFGGTQPNSTYKVNVTPTSSLSVGGYVSAKTTTTFDYTFPIATGTLTFDYDITQ